MANQQQVDYIKQQLQQRVSREETKSALIMQGWKEQDIDAASR